MSDVSFGLKQVHILGMKGYAMKRELTINDWRRMYFAFDKNDLKFFSDESCEELCDSFTIDESCFVYCTNGDHESHPNLIKLEVPSRTNTNKCVLYLSMESLQNQKDCFITITDIIHDGFRLVSQLDVWPAEFYPIFSLHCKYMDTHVSDGEVVLTTMVCDRPTVSFKSRIESAPLSHFSILLINVDWSLSDDVSSGVDGHVYLNWAVVDMLDGNVSAGLELASYESPQPNKASAFSRHFFLLFKHANVLTSAQSSTLKELATRREHFSVKSWADCLGMSSPVAIDGFRLQRQVADSTLIVSIESNVMSDSGLSSPAKGASYSPSTPLSASNTKTLLFSPRSALKKATQGTPRNIASPAKKLVSFQIVHPTLMSDSLVVSPSFYEGLEHEQPAVEEVGQLLNNVEEDGDSADDLPDYQVEYASVGNGGHSISSHNMASRHASGVNGESSPISPTESASKSDALSLATAVGGDSDQSPRLSPTSANTNTNSSNPAGRQVTRQTSSEINMVGNGSNRSLVPLMQRVGLAQKTEDYCAVFGVSTASIFEGEMMRKKFTRDFVMKESFVWIEPASKSIHWARSATQKNVKHKHILLDKNSSYNLVGADGESLKTPPVSPSSGSQFVYKKTAGGTLAGVIKGAELEDLTITVTTEDDQRLKIKIPANGSFATLRAKEWFKVIKLLTQDTAK